MFPARVMSRTGRTRQLLQPALEKRSAGGSAERSPVMQPIKYTVLNRNEGGAMRPVKTNEGSSRSFAYAIFRDHDALGRTMSKGT